MLDKLGKLQSVLSKLGDDGSRMARRLNTKRIQTMTKVRQHPVGSQVYNAIKYNPGKSAAAAALVAGAPVVGMGVSNGIDAYKDYKKKQIILQNVGYGLGAAGMAGIGALANKVLSHPNTDRALTQHKAMVDAISQIRGLDPKKARTMLLRREE
jgi:hypothetical protein